MLKFNYQTIYSFIEFFNQKKKGNILTKPIQQHFFFFVLIEDIYPGSTEFNKKESLLGVTTYLKSSSS